MKQPLGFLTLAFCLLVAVASPTPATVGHSGTSDFTRNANVTNPRPLVVWHGLGDSHSSPGMLQFVSMIKDIHPGIFVHSVYIEEELDADRKAGWLGNVNDQIEKVAGQLNEIEQLQNGFDAIGFSQAGQFFRAYIERYNSPPIHNLITFGSQHMGIADLPGCAPGPSYFWCIFARRAAERGVYGSWAQNNLIQAQYFRDPTRLPLYLASNNFLPDINNELPEDYSLPPTDAGHVTRNNTYKTNFLSLNKLILVIFTEDKTVVPKESAWFGSYAPPEQTSFSSLIQFMLSHTPLAPLSSLLGKFGWTDDKVIIPMRLQPMYLEDTIGLRTLDERGDVRLESCVGEHMRMADECWVDLVEEFCGGQL
ncbi:hypothetical protein JAAARDRAFT_178024 [Jaapia argillacea MUCL 33604]|uniref:Palmitoyl-protein thioesterase 1 n=1 Tax=Jaapia argillacea MUCL 33604 TaxID=933084 RepID=A0A067PSE6_9AGAM|nr:hypothetical protein JAAARDRAFT_178024 [Jaapia argillacea MUCL 33604]